MLRRWFGSESGRVSRREADLLLDGEPTGRTHAGLSDLLAAAAAPARPDELAGERAAVAASRREFRPAGPAPDARRARDSRKARGTRRRRRAAIVAALSAAVLTVGGTAYAASTGRLPDPVQRVVDGVFAGGGTPSGSPTQQGRTGGPAGASPTAAGSGSASTGPGGAPGVSDSRLNGLCRSWEAVRGNPHTNSISAEDLQVLADAAGGEDRIGAFCAALRNRTAQPAEPGRPGNPDPGGGRPTAPPGGGPTKKDKPR
jgi:hypothetical protein